MLELEIMGGCSQAPVLQSVKVGTSTPSSPCDGIFTGEEEEEGN